MGTDLSYKEYSNYQNKLTTATWYRYLNAGESYYTENIDIELYRLSHSNILKNFGA